MKTKLLYVIALLLFIFSQTGKLKAQQLDDLIYPIYSFDLELGALMDGSDDPDAYSIGLSHRRIYNKFLFNEWRLTYQHNGLFDEDSSLNLAEDGEAVKYYALFLDYNLGLILLDNKVFSITASGGPSGFRYYERFVNRKDRGWDLGVNGGAKLRIKMGDNYFGFGGNYHQTLLDVDRNFTTVNFTIGGAF